MRELTSFIFIWVQMFYNFVLVSAIQQSESAMKVKAAKSCSTLCYPIDCRPEHWSGQLFPSPGNLPNSGIKPRSPALQVDSLPAEPTGKPRNTGAGSLSLLQKIFLTQEWNQGLLDCRQFVNQLSYQGISYTYTYIPSLLKPPPTLFLLTPLGHYRTPS